MHCMSIDRTIVTPDCFSCKDSFRKLDELFPLKVAVLLRWVTIIKTDQVWTIKTQEMLYNTTQVHLVK